MNRPLPYTSYGYFKMFEIFNSEFGTVSMCRRFHACIYEFFTMAAKSVVHGVHKVVIQSSFSVIQ